MHAASFDALVASRFFMVMPRAEDDAYGDAPCAPPGGRCFIAEPRSALRATYRCRAMWMLARMAALASAAGRPGAYREPARVDVMNVDEFGSLVGSQPWNVLLRWHDRWYQYAVCEKAREDPVA